MRTAHPLERTIGIDYYVSETDGIGGRLRASPEDFEVTELETIEPEPLEADPGDYPCLLVRATLRDWETNAFARELSDRMGISRERISWAGTKDKRAISTQLLSVRGVSPDELPAIRDATIEPIGRFGRDLLHGDLAGNEFEITITDPERPDLVTAITDDLEQFGGGSVGVPNFFGHQRFGSRRPVTHAVGLRIIRGDWKGAVMTYLAEAAETEPDRTQEVRRYIAESEDWVGALDRMPGHLHHERAMLHALAESDDGPRAYRAALEALPENLQRLFVHAAQSLIFNRILSIRLEYGLPFDRAVEGDVVCFTAEQAGLTVPDPDRTQRVTEDRLETINRHISRGRAMVTAPLVGTETAFGEGDPGSIERSVMDDLNLTRPQFDNPGAFESTGTRRAILVGTELAVDMEPLTLSFALPKGAYATVLLREYLKTSPLEL